MLFIRSPNLTLVHYGGVGLIQANKQQTASFQFALWTSVNALLNVSEMEHML